MTLCHIYLKSILRLTWKLFHQRLGEVPEDPGQYHGQREKEAVSQPSTSPHDLSAGDLTGIASASGCTRGQRSAHPREDKHLAAQAAANLQVLWPLGRSGFSEQKCCLREYYLLGRRGIVALEESQNMCSS